MVVGEKEGSKSAAAPGPGSRGESSGRGSRGEASGARRSGGPGGGRSWMATHGRDLRFLVLFGLFMGVYYGLSTTATSRDRFFPWYLEASAQACGRVLHAFGFTDVQVRGKALISARGRVTVERGCDAITPCALFLAAVLASPVRFSARLAAVLVGCGVLLVINLVRIISLYLTSVYWRSAFEVMHLDVWQSLFILLSILFWALWAAWASGGRERRTDASA